MENNEIILIDILREIIKHDNKDDLISIIEDNHPIDISLALEEFSDEELAKICKLIDTEDLAKILEESEEDLQIRLISLLGPVRIVKMFTYMSTDDIADIIGFLPTSRRKDFYNLMKDKDTKEIQLILGYGEDTAGGIMTTQYIALKSNMNLKQTLSKIKSIGPKTEVIEVLFVVNDKNELIGTADLRDILVSPEETMLIDIIDEHFICVTPEVDQEEVSLLVSKYDLKAIPVVNRKGAILGIITVDDIIDVIVEEHTEDVLKLAGVSKDERIDGTVFSSIKTRLPWLYINLITAFLASMTVSMFEDVITQVVALAATMPIVAGMGGNAGTQTLSIAIRSIALGEVTFKENWKLVFKELSVGVINGLATGIVTGILLYFVYGNFYLGVIIMVAMIGNLVIAGMFGFLIPLLLKSLKVDPAISSSIFLTTATDVGGFFIFLGLAKLFLPLLL